ncbi:MAG: hypothetical protein ACQERJ_07845 [Bacillota bacterium]
MNIKDEKGMAVIGVTLAILVVAGVFIAAAATVINSNLAMKNFEGDRSQALYKAESQITYGFSEAGNILQNDVIDQIQVGDIMSDVKEKFENIDRDELLEDAKDINPEGDFDSREKREEAVESDYNEFLDDKVREIEREAKQQVKQRFENQLGTINFNDYDYSNDSLDEMEGQIDDFVIDSNYESDDTELTLTIETTSSVSSKGRNRTRSIVRTRDYDFDLDIIAVNWKEEGIQLGDNPFGDPIRAGGDVTGVDTDSRDDLKTNLSADKIPRFDKAPLKQEAREERFREDFERAPTYIPRGRRRIEVGMGGKGHLYDWTSPETIPGTRVPFDAAKGEDYHYYKSHGPLSLAGGNPRGSSEIIHGTPEEEDDGKPLPRIVFVEGDITIDASEVNFQNHYFVASGNLNIKVDENNKGNGNIDWKDSYLFGGNGVNIEGDGHFNFSGSMMTPGNINIDNPGNKNLESSDNLRLDMLPDAFVETIIDDPDSDDLVTARDIDVTEEEIGWEEK